MRGSAPAAGFENEAPRRATHVAAIHPVVRARNAGGSEMSGGLAGREALAVAALRIETRVGYDAIAFYSCENGFVLPCFAGGEDQRGLGALRVPRGEGLVGWVAETGEPILNGNPSVEPGYPDDGRLASALALPLMSEDGMVGVLALYRKERDAFAAEDLVALLGACSSVASILAGIELQTADPDSVVMIAQPA